MSETQEPNPVVMVLPVNGNPRRQKLSDTRVTYVHRSRTFDRRGHEVCNDVVVFDGFTRGFNNFSGLIAGKAKEVSFHKTQFTVDPNNLPEDMPGYWAEVDNPIDCTSDHNDAWVVDFRVVCDEEGLPKWLPINQNARAYVGDVFIVKRLFNTETSSEVP